MASEAFIFDGIRGRASGSLHRIKPVSGYRARELADRYGVRFTPPKSLVERADAQGAL